MCLYGIGVKMSYDYKYYWVKAQASVGELSCPVGESVFVSWLKTFAEPASLALLVLLGRWLSWWLSSVWPLLPPPAHLILHCLNKLFCWSMASNHCSDQELTLSHWGHPDPKEFSPFCHYFLLSPTWPASCNTLVTRLSSYLSLLRSN